MAYQRAASATEWRWKSDFPHAGFSITLEHTARRQWVWAFASDYGIRGSTLQQRIGWSKLWFNVILFFSSFAIHRERESSQILLKHDSSNARKIKFRIKQNSPEENIRNCSVVTRIWWTQVGKKKKLRVRSRVHRIRNGIHFHSFSHSDVTIIVCANLLREWDGRRVALAFSHCFRLPVWSFFIRLRPGCYYFCIETMHRCDAHPPSTVVRRTDLWHSTRINEVDGDEPQKAQKKNICHFDAIHTTDGRMGVGCGAFVQWKIQQMESQPTHQPTGAGLRYVWLCVKYNCFWLVWPPLAGECLSEKWMNKLRNKNMPTLLKWNAVFFAPAFAARCSPAAFSAFLTL